VNTLANSVVPLRTIIEASTNEFAEQEAERLGLSRLSLPVRIPSGPNEWHRQNACR